MAIIEMMAVKFVLGLLAIFILVTFAINNQQTVEISYYFGHNYSAKLWLAIMISFIAGAVLAGIGASFSILRVKAKNWSLSRKLGRLEKELGELKQKPLPDEPDVYPGPEPATPSLLAAANEMKSIPARAGGQEGRPD